MAYKKVAINCPPEPEGQLYRVKVLPENRLYIRWVGWRCWNENPIYVCDLPTAKSFGSKVEILGPVEVAEPIRRESVVLKAKEPELPEEE